MQGYQAAAGTTATSFDQPQSTAMLGRLLAVRLQVPDAGGASFNAALLLGLVRRLRLLSALRVLRTLANHKHQLALLVAHAGARAIRACTLPLTSAPAVFPYQQR